MIKDILKFWYKVEYSTPSWLVNVKRDIDLINNELPWLVIKKIIGKFLLSIYILVSRAKYRIAVIGDYDLWKDISHVKVLCKCLERIIY